MNNVVEKWVNEWSIQENDDIFRTINSQVNFFSQELFHDYQPVQGLGLNFRNRLEKWLLNISNEEDRKILFKMLPHLFYIGNKEFNTLYRVAYNELIASWLIDIDKIMFDNFNEAKILLNQSIKNCWICPVTDSLNINSFFHINNIPGNGWNEWRPQWYTIDRGNNLWKTYYNYIMENDIKKLIIMEDFVGSGSQIEGVAQFVMDQGLDIDVLLLPLINCPVGVERFKQLENRYNRLTYKSVIEPSEICFINKTPVINEPKDFDQIRDMIQRVYNKTSCGVPEGNKKPYSPFGFRNTGGLIVMFSNTPDNTIPSIHWKSNSWNPIFPRHSRN